MQVLRFIEIMIDAVLLPARADKADGGARRLLHHIAERSGQLQLTRAVHNGDFHLQQLSADRRPGKPVDQADFIMRRDQFGTEFARPKDRNDIVVVHNDLFFLA